MKLFGIHIGDNPKNHIKLGDEYFKKNELEKAIVEYKKALELDPKNAVASEKLRQIYREKETLKAVFAIASQMKQAKEEVKETTIKKVEEKSDRRQYVRVKDERPITFRFLHSKEVEIMPASDRNISAGGIFLITEQKISIGTFLELRFDFPPPDEGSMWVIGRVVRMEEIMEEEKLKYGYGIRFTNINPKDQKRIENYVSEVSKGKK